MLFSGPQQGPKPLSLCLEPQQRNRFCSSVQEHKLATAMRKIKSLVHSQPCAPRGTFYKPSKKSTTSPPSGEKESRPEELRSAWYYQCAERRGQILLEYIHCSLYFPNSTVGSSIHFYERDHGTRYSLLTHLNSQSKLSQEELIQLQKSTHFDKKELQQWYKGQPPHVTISAFSRANMTCRLS